MILLLYVFYLFALAAMNMAAALEDTLPEDMRAMVEEEEEDRGDVRPQAIAKCLFSSGPLAFFLFPLPSIKVLCLCLELSQHQLPSWSKREVERFPEQGEKTAKFAHRKTQNKHRYFYSVANRAFLMPFSEKLAFFETWGIFLC